MRSLNRRPSSDLRGNPFADVIRRHERRHEMRRAGLLREGGFDLMDADESPDAPHDGNYYDGFENSDELVSAEQSSSSTSNGGGRLQISGLSERSDDDPSNRWYSKR